jgi:hypothetical protein
MKFFVMVNNCGHVVRCMLGVSVSAAFEKRVNLLPAGLPNSINPNTKVADRIDLANYVP